MFKIDFFIPDKTILLENSRRLEAMSLEDIIYWCFSSEIHFKESSHLLLSLNEVPLFQLVEGASEASKKISSKKDLQTLIDNRYGTFTLLIQKSEEYVIVREQFKGNKFQVSMYDFIKGTRDFVSSVIKQIPNLFPGLAFNQSYIDRVRYWQDCINSDFS